MPSGKELRLADIGKEVPAQSFTLPALPWSMEALSPVISSQTLQIHHEQHHAAYVDTANRLMQDCAELAGKSALEIVRWAALADGQAALSNAASQAWNHCFQWQSLSPQKHRPKGRLRDALEREFGGYARFANEFASAGVQQFGSGWLWLTLDDARRVRIHATANADSPAARGEHCLLTIDLWEHAYHIDHQNRRREYLDAVIDRRLNWEFAHENFIVAA